MVWLVDRLNVCSVMVDRMVLKLIGWSVGHSACGLIGRSIVCLIGQLVV